MRMDIARKDIEAIDAQLHGIMGWAAHLEVAATKHRDQYMVEKKRIQSDYQQRMVPAHAKGSASTFSRLTLMVVQRGNTLGLQWHTVGVGPKTKKPYYKYIRAAKEGDYHARTLSALARDWERDLVLATEADCVVIRSSWRQMSKIRRALLKFRSDSAKALGLASPPVE